MKVITCYSYKGGVGRTLTAANFALYLAKLGFKVIAIDFDFEAPGLDSKFKQIQVGGKGMLDLILDYQLSGVVPNSLDDYVVTIPLDNSGDGQGTLQLIPAGNYFGEEYAGKLNRLRWDAVFAEKKHGVAFLEKFLGLLEGELGADYVVVDSRTGISETAGVCTQLLADEVLMFSSLAAESVKMTSHLAEVIRKSKVAEALGKQIEVKIVVTRVPRPRNVEAFRQKWRGAFGAPEDRFFVLFSSPLLESSEYLAVNSPTLSGELTANYIELFQSLKLELATDRIKAQIEQTTRNLLAQPESAESKVRSLVALYPCIESYRTAMRFFVVAKQSGEVKRFALLILQSEPNDIEAHILLGKTYIDIPISDGSSRKEAIKIFKWLDEHGLLTPEAGVGYADLLEDDRAFHKSFEMAKRFMDDESLALEQRNKAKAIAVRTAESQNKRDVAVQLALQIPRDGLRGIVGALLAEYYMERKDIQNALEVAKIVLSHSPSSQAQERLAKIAKTAPDAAEFRKLVERASLESQYLRDIRGERIYRRHIHEIIEDSPLGDGAQP